MKGDPRIIDLLNEVLTGELTADQPVLLARQDVPQLGLPAPRQEDLRGVDRRDEARRQARRARALPRRSAQPSEAQQARDRARRSIEILKNDLALESGTVPRLNKGIQLCRDVGDNGSEDAPDLHPRRVREARGLARVPARARSAGRRRPLSCPANSR